ncbi:MAG: hypothetical protein J0H75_08645, partial [Rhizobiales bacterium]|nr:hypothetical protein [Hyphomicrobiales bacterium]
MARDLAGFELERTPAPIDLDGMLIEHVIFFHGSSAGVKASKHESHAQDGGTLFAGARRTGRHVRETSVRRSCHGSGILNGFHPSDGAGDAIVLR